MPFAGPGQTILGRRGARRVAGPLSAAVQVFLFEGPTGVQAAQEFTWNPASAGTITCVVIGAGGRAFDDPGNGSLISGTGGTRVRRTNFAVAAGSSYRIRITGQDTGSASPRFAGVIDAGTLATVVSTDSVTGGNVVRFVGGQSATVSSGALGAVSGGGAAGGTSNGQNGASGSLRGGGGTDPATEGPGASTGAATLADGLQYGGGGGAERTAVETIIGLGARGCVRIEFTPA